MLVHGQHLYLAASISRRSTAWGQVRGDTSMTDLTCRLQNSALPPTMLAHLHTHMQLQQPSSTLYMQQPLEAVKRYNRKLVHSCLARQAH